MHRFATLAGLLVAATVVTTPLVPAAAADEPANGPHSDTVALETGTPSARGTVNLEGFAEPLEPGMRPGGLVVGGRGDWGGFAGYRFQNSKDDPRTGYGINLQIGTARDTATDAWRLQPGVDYTAALSPSWLVSSRLFSTYGLDTAPATSRGSFDGGEGGFRDVGLGFGLGYAPSESWTVQGQAGYSLQLRSQSGTPAGDANDEADEFFGGVIINYRF
jgi:hypothetical protein